jgi:hypothetical protein
MIVRTSSNWTSIAVVVTIGAAVYIWKTRPWQRRQPRKIEDENEIESLYRDLLDHDDEEQPLDDPLRYLDQDKWKKLDTSLEQFIRQLPKVELHVHLDGSFDTDVLWQYLQQTSDQQLLGCLPVTTTLPWDQSQYPVR